MCCCIGSGQWWCGVDVEPPHTGSCLFPKPLKIDSTGAVDNLEICVGEDYLAVCVAESPYAEKVVGEGTHDVAIFGACGYVREEESGVSN